MRNIVDASKLDLKSTIVSIRRVAKTVKGGRNMRFSVTVVVGDGNGYVGVGLGKSQEIPEAVRKAEEDAKKNLIYVPTVGTTVPHKNLGVFGAGRVLIMPAAQGTGAVSYTQLITVILFLAAITAELGRMLGFDPVPVILSEIFCANLGGSATMCGDPPNVIIGTSLGYTFTDFIQNTGVIVGICLLVVVVYFSLRCV